ncbi:tyrosine-type recombinase/integrase [Pseudomonas sp. C9-3]|uniref:tyrosine-type recombinase/integrase n=1 Tax=Pseudomonas sp. C9-3 TaxID=3078264 RepID=UPI0028E40844|nr:tyrosine-type recombinase/integrase [Pseudomonas sp. C9-3]
MGTITQRKNKSGEIKYTTQIRLRRGGKIVYQETRSFDRKAAASAWLKLRETELAVPGALDRANRKGAILREIINRYLTEYEIIRPLGRTKRLALNAIAKSWLGDLKDTEITSQRVVEFGQWRMTPDGGGVQAQTVGNDLAHLGSALSVARPAWGHEIDSHAIPDARRVLRSLGMVSKSKERTRRPTLDELDKMLSHFAEMQVRRPYTINMLKLTGFAIFSTRREEEICRIRWEDYEPKAQRVLVRDMKNPGQKIGNDVWCHLPPEAILIIESMPRDCAEIFPYTAKSVGSLWNLTCKVAGVQGLTFHDLRHEGISRLFELSWDIPRVASTSGHRSWASLRRYTHLQRVGDRFEGWPWLERIVNAPVVLPTKCYKKGA